MSEPIVVRLTQQVRSYPPGAELGFADADDAARVLGEGAFTVVRLQNGQPVAAPARNLQAMTRAELDAEAERIGVADPAALPNKAAVIAAIEGAEA